MSDVRVTQHYIEILRSASPTKVRLTQQYIEILRSTDTYEYPFNTTPVPTTPAPTTKAPTTAAPTTKAPTTAPPTTAEPTTAAPTSLAPTTVPPTTEPPATICWGHDTGVEEDEKVELQEWTGTAAVTGSGDAEKISFQTGEEGISPTWKLGTGEARITLNKYLAGDTVSIQYKTGASSAACEADSWHDYSPPGFTSLMWVKIRLYR